MFRRVSVIVPLLATLASFAIPAAPQTTVPSTPQARVPEVRLRGPIKITAERAELERREYALYRGRVRLVSEDLVLTGDRLELRQPAKGQYEARLTGAPARLDHPGDASGPPVSASAAQIVYDTRTATVDLSGGVKLARGPDQLASAQVRYNLAARRISASGSDEGQVHLTITPPPRGAKQPPILTPAPSLRPR